MDKKNLIEVAPDLTTVSQVHIEEFLEKMEILVAEMNDTMCKRPDIYSLVGEDNIQMMKDNHANHMRFVYSLLENYDKQVLVDTVSWVYRSYRSRGFHMNYWAAQINTWIDLLRKHLSESAFAEIFPLYRWFSISVPHFSNISDDDLEKAQTTRCSQHTDETS